MRQKCWWFKRRACDVCTIAHFDILFFLTDNQQPLVRFWNSPNIQLLLICNWAIQAVAAHENCLWLKTTHFQFYSLIIDSPNYYRKNQTKLSNWIFFSFVFRSSIKPESVFKCFLFLALFFLFFIYLKSQVFIKWRLVSHRIIICVYREKFMHV